tara:strand:- start:193 stop:591 length:399 start_codon:yes stop_codon:yes gene_type:complete
MEKFLSVYVNAADITGGFNLIPSTSVLNVVQTSATVTTINFISQAAGVQAVALTHTALPSYAQAIAVYNAATGVGGNVEQCRSMRNLFVDAISTSLQTGWTSPEYGVSVPGWEELPGAGTQVDVTITAIVWS